MLPLALPFASSALSTAGNVMSFALPFLANLFGSVSNRNAQQQANESNLQIARETNDTNIMNTKATNETIMESGRQTNDANLRIAENTNRTNAEIAAADRRAQIEQWNRETEYNTPAAQAARFRAAGLNPSLASGDNGNAGSLSLRSSDPAVFPSLENPATGISAPSASAMATMVAPQMNMDLGLSDLYSRFLDNSIKAEQVEGANIDNQIKRATQRAQIMRLVDEAKKAGYDSEVSRLESILRALDVEIKRDTKDDVVGTARATRKREEENAKSAEQQYELSKLEVSAKQEENAFLDKYHGKQLAEVEQHIKQIKQAISIAWSEEGRNKKRFDEEIKTLHHNQLAAFHDKEIKMWTAKTLANEFIRRYGYRFSYIDKDGKTHWQSAADVDEAIQSTPIGKLTRALGLTGKDLIDVVKTVK